MRPWAYFSHKAFKTSRAFQFILALLAQTTGMKGVIWWASHHRWHHKYSDTPKDVHSARLRGFWYSHIGWIMRPEWDETDHSMVADLAKMIMEHGGQPRGENWFWRIIHFRRQEQVVYLDNPISLTVTD